MYCFRPNTEWVYVRFTCVFELREFVCVLFSHSISIFFVNISHAHLCTHWSHDKHTKASFTLENSKIRCPIASSRSLHNNCVQFTQFLFSRMQCEMERVSISLNLWLTITWCQLCQLFQFIQISKVLFNCVENVFIFMGNMTDSVDHNGYDALKKTRSMCVSDQIRTTNDFFFFSNREFKVSIFTLFPLHLPLLPLMVVRVCESERVWWMKNIFTVT